MEEQRSPVKARVGEGERSSLGILVRKKFLKKVNFSLVGLATLWGTLLKHFDDTLCQFIMKGIVSSLYAIYRV